MMRRFWCRLESQAALGLSREQKLAGARRDDPGLDERRAEKISMSWAPERLSQGSSMVGMEKHLWRPPAPAPAPAGVTQSGLTRTTSSWLWKITRRETPWPV